MGQETRVKPFDYKPEPEKELVCQAETSSNACMLNSKTEQDKQDMAVQTPTIPPKTSSNSPTTTQLSSQANSAANVRQGNQLSSNTGGGGVFIPGAGFVTPDGRTYPTNNPNWKPNPNAPRYEPPQPKPTPKTKKP